MKLAQFRSLASLLCVGLFSIGALNANVEARKPLTSFEQHKIDEERLSHFPEELLQNNGFFSGTEDFKDYRYLDFVHPDVNMYLTGCSDYGDLIQFHDGSEWSVGFFSRGIVKEWASNDLLYIKPKNSWFSYYNYVIQNRTTNESIDVNLVSVPLFPVVYTLEIVNLDPTLKVVQLSDGTLWQINKTDYAFKYWKLGDRLIVGVNNYWRMDSYVHILINTTYYNNPYCEANYIGS